MIARNLHNMEIFDEFLCLHRISGVHNFIHFSKSIRTRNDEFHRDDMIDRKSKSMCDIRTCTKVVLNCFVSLL